MAEIDVSRVVGAFEQAGAAWALVGAHAVGLFTEPRATVDFDFVVDGAKIRTVIQELRAAFGELGERDVGAAVQLGRIDVDLIRSTNHALFAETLRRARRSGDWNVPPPEVLIVLKFLAAVSPWRERNKRGQDVVDLRGVYLVVGRDQLDVGLMTELAGMAYPGAEAEFSVLLERIDRGEPIAI